MRYESLRSELTTVFDFATWQVSSHSQRKNNTLYVTLPQENRAFVVEVFRLHGNHEQLQAELCADDWLRDYNAF
jgi:hypothetical protein